MSVLKGTVRIVVLGGGFGGVTTVRHLGVPDASMDRRLRIVLDWTVALFFRPDITKVELHVEREQIQHAQARLAS